MKSRIIAIILVILFSMVALAATTSEAYIPSETTNTSLDNLTKAEIVKLMIQASSDKESASAMANAARNLGYGEDHTVILLAKKEWEQANKNYNLYKNKHDELIAEENQKWAKKSAEYPAATVIWRYLKGMGYNDYVCAGIMGNIMVEVGGQTLNINYKAHNKTYYGMCQWSKGYSEVWGADLNGQCEFLANSIRYEFNTFGFVYKQGFKYENFISLTNEKQAALAFAKCYERCGSGSYGLRQKCATKAYEYFVN